MANFTLVPPENSITDSARNVWRLGGKAARGQEILRNDVQFADGQGTLLLFFKEKVYAQNDLNEWWIATDTAWERASGDPRAVPDEAKERPRPTDLSRAGNPLKHPFAFGLGMAPEEVSLKQASVLRLGFGSDKSPAFKFLTMGADETARTFQQVHNVMPNALFMARLFCPFNAHDRLTPERFVETVEAGLAVLYNNGVRLFEVHNEPNLVLEGLAGPGPGGVNWVGSWNNAKEFAIWMIDVIGILKSRPQYAEARWLAPGLSPQPNTPSWWNDWKIAGVQQIVDGFCAHAYWKSDAEMRTVGLEWKALLGLFPGKPVYITEFSNKVRGLDFREKGRQYRDYRDLVKANGAAAAFGFVLHWTPPPDQNDDENWAHDNGGSLGVAEGFQAMV